MGKYEKNRQHIYSCKNELKLTKFTSYSTKMQRKYNFLYPPTDFPDFLYQSQFLLYADDHQIGQSFFHLTIRYTV